MGWHRAPEAEIEYDAALCEMLLRDDDGVWLGSIMRFYKDGATYAHNQLYRLGGAWSDDAAARRAVEDNPATRKPRKGYPMTNPSTGAPAAAPSFPAFLAGINPFDFIKYLPLVSRLMEVGPQIKTALASGASVDVILAKLVPDLAPLLASVGQQFFPQTTAALHPAAGLELVFDNDGTKWVQNGLNRLGLAASPAATPLRVDGDYGRNTIAAVKAYQTAHGLKPDGWAGPKTSASIALELAKLPAQ